MQRCNGVLAPVSMQFHPAALRAVLYQVDALDDEQEIESRDPLKSGIVYRLRRCV